MQVNIPGISTNCEKSKVGKRRREGSERWHHTYRGRQMKLPKSLKMSPKD